jgi:glycosyltransferase involved in cell wall biosynthesis
MSCKNEDSKLQNNIEVSFIIPCYNAEEYLPECLDSIEALKNISYEILAVDDGSSDLTAQILTERSRTDDHLSVFTQPNSGVSAARNMAMKHAAGKYVFFIDADDRLIAGGIQDLFKEIDDHPADMLIFNYDEIFADGSFRTDNLISCKAGSGREGIDRIFLSDYLLNTCWGILFKRDFVLRYSLDFEVGVRVGEDTAFVAEALSRGTAEIVPYKAYTYRQTASGAVNSSRTQMGEREIRDFSKVYCVKYDYARKMNVSYKLMNSFWDNFIQNLSAYLNLMIKYEKNLSAEKRNADMLISDKDIQQLFRECKAFRLKNRKNAVLRIVFESRKLRDLYICIKHGRK